MPPPNHNPILAYPPGPLPIHGCLTVELTVVPGTTLASFINIQYTDSTIMSRRPGMYLKYLPYRYEAATGCLLSGGCYLLDAVERAGEYGKWTKDEFKVGENRDIPFFEFPAFVHSARQVWRVVGGHQFAPIEEHAAGRLVRFTYSVDGNIEELLKSAYENMKYAAQKQGAASFVLLWSPEDRKVGVYQAFKKVGESDAAGAEKFLKEVEGKSTLEDLLPEELGAEKEFDRSSLLLTVWLPRSREAGGEELTIPNFPLVPDVTVPRG